MRLFSRLFTSLDESNSTLRKVAALETYFREAPPEDAAWALWFLTGNRFKSSVRSSMLREWASTLSGLPLWLVEESYDVVGDLAETVALLLPEAEEESRINLPLHQLVKEYVEPLRLWDDPIKFNLLRDIWFQLTTKERFVYNKLITGAFRVGVSKTLVIRALAKVAEIEPPVMSHRLMGKWEPTAESFKQLMAKEDRFDNPARPYPFYLAYPLEEKAKKDLHGQLGEMADWQIEWKWDGIRAQLIRRQGQSLIWSRGEEMMTDRFPEITTAADFLPDGLVLDGEILAWREGRPLPFGEMQKRIGRKKLTTTILKEVPVIFMGYDCLEHEGIDIREKAFRERQQRLQEVLAQQPEDFALRLSPPISATEWNKLPPLLESSRERGVEGFMIKKQDTAYKVGRVKGDWWKWKVDPLTMDAVMIYAQSGHGRRAGLYTDYTFAVWSAGELVPIAKAYSGLTDEEISKVDRFIRSHTTDRFGPVRVVKPLMVFELAFEGIQRSSRHKSGLAVRFPRIKRIREDKPPEQADTLETLEGLL